MIAQHLTLRRKSSSLYFLLPTDLSGSIGGQHLGLPRFVHVDERTGEVEVGTGFEFFKSSKDSLGFFVLGLRAGMEDSTEGWDGID